MAGLVPSGFNPSPNLRLVPTLGQVDTEPQQIDLPEVSVAVSNDNGDMPEYDEKGALLKIKHADGSVTVSIDGKPLVDAKKDKLEGWYANLVDDIDEQELSRIADDLLRGVDDDVESRKDWIDTRAKGLMMLGIKLEVPGLAGASDGAPVEGMSKVRHPLLLEAVLRFQANARSELLPTDGPVKIRNDNNNADLSQDQLANALERDANHYLTSTASEYYPDTDRMLLMLGFGGTSFKKVYYCPLRNRPVSESVDAEDLIVNDAATDLQNARRVTHRIMMKPSTVKRFQILGVYRDIELDTPKQATLDAAQQFKKDQQGIAINSSNPDDRMREIYECYCELNVVGQEHTLKGKETGLEIPYRVTLDVSSRKVLSIVRNYAEDDAELPEAHMPFTKYTFVPGLGFYDIGLVHILGNTTNAITAAWRELLDAGMYANFPGFLMADTGARQNTNIFRIPPGGGALVKTGGMRISEAVMALPYKEPSGALMSLVDNMAQTGMRIGGTSEAQVGEGRADAPVGTTLAMIEQAAKVLNAVHKRMHAAQADEFRKLMHCFKEHPNSFWQKNRKPAYPWDEATFVQALQDYDLTPQADPNTASHGQRVMKIIALKQLQAANPTMYDPIAIDTAAMQAMGWSNPQQFFAPPSAQAAPPPEMQKQIAEMQVKKQDADSRTMTAQANAAKVQSEIAQGPAGSPQTTPANEAEMMTAQAKLIDAQVKARGEPPEPGPSPVDVLNARTKAQEAQNEARDLAVRHAQNILDAQNHQVDARSNIGEEQIRFAHDAHSDAQSLKQQELVNKGEQIKVQAARSKLDAMRKAKKP